MKFICMIAKILLVLTCICYFKGLINYELLLVLVIVNCVLETKFNIKRKVTNSDFKQK